MGLFDDLKNLGGNVVEGIGDLFDGSDDQEREPLPPQRQPQRGDFKTIIDEPSPQGPDSERPLWMTGGNADGMQNAWNSDFMERFQKQQQEVIDKDEYDSWFDREDATGVVLADFTTKGGMQVKAGQVFDNGKVIDLEERYGKEGRDQLLSQLMFDSKTLQKIYSDQDIPARLGREVDAAIQKNTENVAAALGRDQFQERVDEDEDNPFVQALGALGSVLGGGAAGAGAGSLFGGVGAVPGFFIGAGSGLASYFLNRDDANEQMARALNVVRDASEEGLAQGVVTGLGQFGQQALRTINPLNEAYKGALDRNRGDGEADYYERAEENPWIKTGNFVTLGIGTVPSVAGLGLKAYLTGIGAATAGGVGELATGQRFDYATGKFENVYDSPGTAAAAIGTTAIDALQLGMVGAIGKQIRGTTDDVAGMTFKRDADGALIEGSQRAGLTSLVPSDFIMGAVARYDARRAALAASGGTSNRYSTDQLYTAASALTNSSNVGKAALVVGFAEGAEEGVQAIFDEAQFGRVASFETVRDAFFAGTAMGAGFGVGRNLGTRQSRDTLLGYAKNGFESVTGRPPTEAELASWKSNPEEMNYYAKADREVAAVMEKLTARAAQEQKATTPAGVAITSRASALVQEMVEAERKKSGINPQASWRAQPITNAMSSERNEVGTPKPGMSDEAQEMHLADIVKIFTDARAARAQGAANLQRAVSKGQAEVAAAQGDTADMQTRLAEITDNLALLQAAEGPQEDLLRFLTASLDAVEGAATSADKERLINQLNQQLELAYRDGVMPPGTTKQYDPDAVRFAATLLTYRSPGDNAASLQAYVPRISVSAMLRGDRGFSQNSPFAATGHTADYDGDNMLNDGSIILSRNAFRAMRAGQFDVATDTQELITPVSQAYHINAAEKARVSSGDFRTSAKAAVQNLGTTFINRYGLTPQEAAGLRAELDSIFFTKATGTPLEDVVAAIRKHAGDKMLQYGIDNWTRETIVAPHIVTAYTDDIIDAYNAQAAVEFNPTVNEGEAKAGTQKTVGTRNIRQVRNSRAFAGPLSLVDVLGLAGTDTYLRLHQILWNFQGNSNDPTQDVDAYNLAIERNAQVMRKAAAQTVNSSVEELNETSVAQAVYDLVRISLVDTKVAKEPTPRQVVTAMMQSTNIMRPKAETWSGAQDQRYNTTVLQAALQAVTETIEAENREFLDQNKELRSKIGRLRAMATNPDKQFEAIAEVLSGVELHTLGLTSEELAWLPVSKGGTIGSLIRKLQQLPQAQRRVVVEESRNSGSYDSKRTYNGQKNLELAKAVSEGKASLYHLILDVAKGVADSRIEVQPDGTVTGSLAAQSRTQGANIRTTNERLRELLRQYNGGRTPSAADVMSLFDAYQQELTPVIDALLREGTVSALSRDGGSGVNVRDWLPQVVTEKDPAKAEMILLRNSIAAELHKHDVRAEAKKKTVRISGIRDTWVRAYYLLAQSEPIQAREMMRLLLSETSVESWEQKTNALLNTHSADMPVLAWNRNTDTFTADKPKGGWGAAPTSTQTAWMDAAVALDRFASAETTETRMAADAQVLAMLSEALVNPDYRATSFEFKNFARLADVAALGLRTRIMTNGSRMQTLVDLLSNPSKDGQKKGNAAAAILAWAPVEIEQATLAGRTAPFLQILKFSGAVDIADVIADPSLLMTAAVVKDHDGSIIEVPNWFMPSVDEDGRVTVTPNMEALLESVRDKALYPLMMKLLLPQTSSYSETGIEQTGWMYGSTLDANLGRDIQLDAVTNPAAFGSYMSHLAQMNDPDDVALFESRVVSIALREILARDTIATPNAVLAALRSAEEDLARAMFAGAAYIRGARGSQEAAVKLRALKTDQRAKATESLKAGAERQGKVRSGTDSVQGLVRTALGQRVQDLIDTYLPQILEMRSLPPELRDLTNQVAALAKAGDIDGAIALQEGAQVEERIQEWRENNSDPFVSLFNQLRAVQDAGLLGALYAKYDLETNPGTALPLLAEYVATHPELRSSISSKRSEVMPIMRMIERNLKSGVNLTLGLQRSFEPKAFQLLARFVIADEMRRAYDPLVAPVTPLHPVPKQDDKSAAFYDPSGAAMLDWVLNENDPLVKVAVQFADDANLDPELMPDQALTRIFSAARGNLWSTSMGYAAEIIRGTFGSASVPQVIPSFGGNSPKDTRVLEAISRTTSASVPQARTAATVTKTDGVLVVTSPTLGNHTLDGMFFTGVDVDGNWGREYMVNGKLTEHPAIDMALIEKQLPEGMSLTFEVIPPWARDTRADVNSVYADGITPMTLRNDDAQMTSAPARLFYAAQGINQKSQRKPLDAIKKAIAAHTQLPARRIQLPAGPALLDNSFMLHDFFADLADLATEIDLGSGALGPRFHRDTYKTATLQYVVVATDLNEVDQYLSPQEWMKIQAQTAEAGQTPAESFSRVTLIPVSPKELEMLYGFAGPKSLSSPLEVADTRALSPRLSDISTEQKQRLSKVAWGQPTRLANTSLARRAWTQPVIPMRAGYNGADIPLGQAITLDEQRYAHQSEVHSDREALQRKGQWNAQDANEVYKATIARMQQSQLSTEGAASSMQNGPAVGTVRGQALEARGQEGRFTLRFGGTGELKTGQLTTGGLERELKKLGVAQGDVVLVPIDSYAVGLDNFEASAKHAFEVLASTGVQVQLMVAPEVKADLTALMPSLAGYAPVPDSPGLWAPRASTYSSQLRRAQESLLLETHASTPAGKLLSIVLDAGSARMLDVNENSGLLGPDSNNLHFTIHNATDIDSPLVDWSSPHPDEEQEYIDFLLANESDVLDQLQKLVATHNIEMSPEKMSLTDAFENLMERARAGRIVKAEGQDVLEGQLNVHLRSRGDGQVPMALFTFEGAVYPDSQADFQDQLDEISVLDRPIAVWSSNNDPEHTSFSGRIVKMFATDSAGRRRMSVLTSLQQVANKLSRVGVSAYKIEPKRAGSEVERRLKGKASIGRHPIALITGPADADSKHLNNGDATSTQRLLEIFGVDLVPTFRKALGLENSRVTDQMVLTTLQQAAYDLGAQTGDIATALSAMNDAVAQQLLNQVGLSFEATGTTIKRLPAASPETKLLTAALLYTAIERTSINDIARIPSSVLAASQMPDQAGVVPPELFTQVIDGDQALRDYVVGLINANPEVAESGWSVDPFDYSVVRNDILTADGTPTQIRGTLNWGVWTARGEQAEKQTAFSTDKSGTSFHNDAFFRAALGEGLATKLDEQALQESVDKLANIPGWDSLTYLPYKVQDQKGQPIKLWQQLTANEIEYQNETRRILNRYFRGVNGKYSAKAKELRDEAFDAAGLSVSREEFYEHFDYWIRQARGNRGKESGTEQKDKLSQQDIEITAETIRNNIRHGMPPTYRGVVRFPIQELRWYYHHGGRIRAFTNEAVPANIHNIEYAEGWTNTVDSTVNWMFNKQQDMWSEFTADNDAVLHGYANETESTLDLPVSRNAIVANELVLKGYDRVLSLDPTVNTMLQDSALHERAAGRPLLEVGGQAIQDILREPIITEQMRASINDRLSSWHRASSAPRPRQQSLNEQRENGVLIPGTNAKAAAFMRPILGVSFVMRAFNPALPVAGLLEAAARKSVWNMSDLLMGQAYTGVLGRWQNRLLNNHRLSPMAAGLGFTPTLTPNQAQAIETWTQNEGEQSEFRMALLGDINYHYDRAGGAAKGLVTLERFTALLQDLGRGIRGKKMAQTYIKHYMTTMVNNGVDIDIVLASMKNPMWLTGQDDYVAIPAALRQKAHAAGIYALASLRGTAPTALSIGADAIIKPWTTSSNTGVNIAGNMLLQLPLMFRQYAANIAVTLPGLQGFDMLAGVFMGARQKGLLARYQEAVSGEKLMGADRFTDTSAVVDPNEIFDMFVRGGVTWSGLFMGASLFGGLGLTGEDEETKRRRKLAALQGDPYARDPRQIENDFRNADAIFLDWLPGFGQFFQQLDAEGNPTRAIAKPHWMLKAFLDPVLGIERWAETGDIRQVGWGFQSAFTSFPLINGSMLHDANETFRELTSEGMEAAAGDSSEQKQLAGLSLFSNAVSYYEKMLMENAFVNSLYVGLDEYDRDPYVLPMRDSDGTIQRDTELNPRKTDALGYFVDEEGKTQQGYISQSDAGAQLRSMTENRFGLAMVSSLFSNLMGNGQSYFRQDMAVKVRNYDRPEISLAQSQAALLALFVTGGGVNQNTASETATTQENAQIQQAMLLSFLDEDGDEILTQHGALAVYNGLIKGSVDLNDESLQNIYIDYPTRVEIQKDWMTRLVQQGVDLGLSKDRALSRAKSVWNGPSDGSAIGFADILWSDSIPYSKTVGYQQLNTTYVIGPDGQPWATGFARTKLMGALGLAPLSGPVAGSNLGVDQRMNSVDPVVGINTGQRGLKRFETSLNVPTDAEIGQSIVDAIEDLKSQNFGQGYGGFGFGGGGGGGGYPQRPVNTYGELARWYNKNFQPIVLRTPYSNDVYSIRTDTVRTDTSTIRRERISSERGRLTQWQ